MAREVVDPSGVRWRVRRRWLPDGFRPRWHGGDGGWLWDFGDVGFGIAELVVAGVLLLVFLVAAVVTLVVLPLVIFLLEVVLLLVLAAASVVARVVLGRPWTLEASAVDGPTRLSWSVSGWRASRDAVDEIARALERGTSAPASLGAPGCR